jgi:hypothetical protein
VHRAIPDLQANSTSRSLEAIKDSSACLVEGEERKIEAAQGEEEEEGRRGSSGEGEREEERKRGSSGEGERRCAV